MLLEATYTVQTESEGDGSHGAGAKKPQEWTLSQKIAAYSVAASVLQFVALLITLAIIRHHGHRHLRAYVLVESAALGDNGSGAPGWFMTIKNYGQTPAYKVISRAEMAVIQNQRENESLSTPVVESQFPTTIGPQSGFNKTIVFDRSITPQEITDIANQSRGIYLYGRIEYIDAFKKKRFTNFRLRYTGQYPPPGPHIVNFSGSGNEAD